MAINNPGRDPSQPSADEWAELEAKIASDEAHDEATGVLPKSGTQDTGKKATEQETKTEETKTASLSPEQASTPPAPEKTPEPPKPEATEPKSKYAKEKERLSKTWQQINADKEALAKERDDLKEIARSLREETAALRTSLAERQVARELPQAAPPEREFSVQDWEQAADVWESQGKFDFAKYARDKAAAIKALPKSPAAPESPVRQAIANFAPRQDPEQEKFLKEQGQWWLKAKEELPDVFDPKGPVYAEYVKMLEDDPKILHYVRGPYLAAQFTKFRSEAGRVPELLKAKEALEKKVKELEELTSVSGPGGAKTQEREKPFEELSLAEQEAALRRDWVESMT